jgi:hypothetical protein
MFSNQGFECRKNLKLSKFDDQLPDIDLLVVSQEETLGYVIYSCEIKNPIPPRWAKDHLRVLSKDSIPKAFQQIERIKDFFHSEEGSQFLRSQLPREGLPHFGDEFLVVCNFLVITSNNAGMFFGNQEQAIIDYRTLGRILNRCDGDVAYLLWALNNINQLTDEYLKIVPVECKVGARTVSYEVTQIGSILDFQKTEYKSTGVDKKLAQDFIREGGHPFDVLKK